MCIYYIHTHTYICDIFQGFQCSWKNILQKVFRVCVFSGHAEFSPYEGQTNNVLRCKLSHQALISISGSDNTLFSFLRYSDKQSR